MNTFFFVNKSQQLFYQFLSCVCVSFYLYMLYACSKCFRNKTFITSAVRSTVFIFLFSFCCIGITLSKKHCSKLLFEGVSVLNTSGVGGWITAFWCKGNSCHVGTQWNPDGASNGCGPIIVWRSWLETGWFTLHEDEWLTDDLVASRGVSLKRISVSGLAAVVVDAERLSSLLLGLIVSSPKFILLKLKCALYQRLLLIKDTWAKEPNCWKKKTFSFVGWKMI